MAARIPSSLLLLLVWLIMGTICALHAAEALTIANNLNGPLTVVTPPGCCWKCGDRPPSEFCPRLCVQCPDVVVAEGKEVTLDKHVGPYPLPSLRIQFEERLYCVYSDQTKSIKASATLAVGPGVCRHSGLQAYVYLAYKPSQVVALCVPPCYA